MSQDPHALNPRQREAVLHGDGPLLILAGAGTGKTRTLAYRIAYLVERGVAPGTILAVAFTNKSAEELKERVKKLIRKGAKAPSVSTFHSFCVRVLRERDRAPRLQAQLHDLRHRRPAFGAEGGAPRGAPDRPRRRRRQTRARRDLARQERGARAGSRRRHRPLRDPRRGGRPALRERAEGLQRRRFRRSARVHAQALPRVPGRSSSAGASAAATSSSTSSRTPTPSSTGSSRCWPAPAATSPSSATTTSRSTAGAARCPATSWISPTTGRRRK